MIDSQTIVASNIRQCLNCGNCIAACKRRHENVSRHVREHSAIIGGNLIPNLCKICRDPKCIKVCNRQGIKMDDEGHIVITDNCVGCGLCVKSCPYNAIHLFSKEEEHEPSLIDKFFSFIRPQKAAAPCKEEPSQDCNGCGECVKACPTGALTLDYIDKNIRKKRRRKVAVKCDGCAGYENRACVHNCPAGALQVMTINNFISRHKGFISIELRELLKYSLEGEDEVKTAAHEVTYGDKRLIFRIIWISLVALIAACLYFVYRQYILVPEQFRYLNTAMHLRLKPSGTLGHALGITGAVSMFTGYGLYALRKKIKRLESWGPLSLWLEIHIFFGILGPVLIIFHSAFILRGIIGLTFIMMMVAVISGVFGRMLFSYCFWGLSKVYESLHEIGVLIENDLRSASQSSPVVKKIMDLKPPGFPGRSGLVKTFKQWRSIKKETGYLVDLINEKYDNGQQEELGKWADQLIKRLREIRSTAFLNLCLATLNKWEIVHKVSSYLFFSLTLVHVLIVLYWGYRWVL